MTSPKQPNLEELMLIGIRSAKEGNRENARIIFKQVLATDKRQVAAWLWLATVAENSIKKRQYLKTVLNIQPENVTAKKQLAAMNRAEARSEGSSIRLGFVILAILIIALVVVGSTLILVYR